MSFHPDVISWVQEALFGTFQFRLVATVALVASVYACYTVLWNVSNRFEGRYSKDVAEAFRTLLLALWIAIVAFLLAVVWDLTVLIRFVAEVILVDRITFLTYVVSVAVLTTAYLLIRVVNRSFDRLTRAGTLTRHQSEVAYHVADASIFAVAVLVVLTLWGVDVTNLLIGAGVLSALLGLGARKTVAAFIAGFLLLFARPFHVNDWIMVVTRVGDKQTGIVEDVTILHTKIRTFNEEHVMIPNDEVTSGQLVNYSRNDRLRVDVEVGVDYETDLDEAEAVIADAVDGIDDVCADPEPRVVAKQFGDSGVLLEVHLWVRNPNRRIVWQVKTSAIRRIKERFEAEGITIPFPQRVHSVRDGEAAVTISEESTAEPRPSE